MWQKDTGDPKNHRPDLGWAQARFQRGARLPFIIFCGKGTEQLLSGIGEFLGIGPTSTHIRVVFGLVDDCWNPSHNPAKQPDPVPGVHNIAG